MNEWMGTMALLVRRWLPSLILVAVLLLVGLSPSHAGKQPWEEYDKFIQARGTITAHGPDLFGDQVDLYSGGLSFSVTDISLQGNSALPVALTRTLSVANRRLHANDTPLADWDLDLPRLSGVFAPGWPANRCSSTLPPPSVHAGPTAYTTHDYWQGVHAHMPGGGEMLVANQAATRKPVTGGPYRWMTSGFTYFSCLPASAAGAGEGFLALTADGTRYWFNHMARYYEPDLASPITATASPHPLQRRRNVLYATRVQDRFGNWVNYSYSNGPASPIRLDTISASDGRRISLGYNAKGHLQTASNGSQTWAYHYSNVPGSKVSLVAVVLPGNGGRWKLDLSELSDAEIVFDGDQRRSCDVPAMVLSSGGIGSVTHPSGAMGHFEVRHRRLGRSNVPKFCVNWEYPTNNPLNDVAYLPRDIDVLALKRKTVSGPGLDTGHWDYTFMATRSWAPETGPKCDDADCMEPICVSEACAGSLTATVTGPDGWKRHTFGNSYRYNEGKLLKVEQGASAAAILRTEVMTYEFARTGQAFPTPIAHSLRKRGDGFTSEYLRPQRSRVVRQDGVDFARRVTGYDVFARPLGITRASTIPASPVRTELTGHHDHAGLWVLGQVARRTINGIVAEETAFDAMARPVWVKAFGSLQHTLGYHPDGTLASVRDGNNRTTTLAGWKRGIPQSIRYPPTPEATAGAVESAIVDDAGLITSTTDENGFTTRYGYDAMGRIARVEHPGGDGIAWHPTVTAFNSVAGARYGLPAGHWQQTVGTGNARRITYFDALWRPVLVETFDASTPVTTAASRSLLATRYDAAGRVGFQSYALPALESLATIVPGTHTTYDALGRSLRVDQDSELGALTRTTRYLDGFQTLATNPNNQSTRTSAFRAYDEPTYDFPGAISHPEGAYTEIQRNFLDQPTSLKRRNLAGTLAVVRSYGYDSHTRLCRTTEPESGSTLVGYDPAGNMAWSASGLPAASACDPSGSAAAVVARKSTRAYDGRNRLVALAFPGGLGDTRYTHTPDGLPATVVTSNGIAGAVNTSYLYNRRRLLTGEALSVGNQLLGTGYGYDASGHLARHVLAGGLAVDYAPNALGQATRAGPYAIGASYFPNGALKRFTYGNGIVHELSQNLRQLPDSSRDSHGTTDVLYDGYDYDRNGNVRAISDGLKTHRSDRTMFYDGLDRLTSVVSPMFGTARYTYDVLDNLRTLRLTSGSKPRDHTYAYDASNRLTNVMQTSGGGTVIGLAYDVQGNLANKNGTVFNFDFGNRLRNVGAIEQYDYDGHGRRVRSTRNVASIYSAYGQDGVLRFQRDERAGKSTQYVYLAGSLVAEVETALPLATPQLYLDGYTSSGSYAVRWSSTTLATRFQLQMRINGAAWTTVHDAAGLSKTVLAASAGLYDHRVRACSATTCGSWSRSAQIAVRMPPAMAPALQVPDQALNGSFVVRWTGIPAAGTYQLDERWGSAAWMQVHDSGGLAKDVAGKAAGSWSYRVRACNASGCSPFSIVAAVQVLLPPSGTPQLTSPSSSNTGAYALSWTAIAVASRYELNERLGSGAWNLLHDASPIGASVVNRGTGDWNYRVRACNAAGCGAFSGTQTVKVTLPPGAASAPQVPAESHTGSYLVSWGPVAAATSYRLQEKVGSGTWGPIQDSSTTKRSVSGKAAGTYGYRVQGCNLGGCGAISAAGAVLVTLPPASAPTLDLPPQSSTGDYGVRWNAIPAASTYQLLEQANGGSWLSIQNSSSVIRGVTAKPDGSYGYQVRACNIAGCGGYSPVRTVKVVLSLGAPALTGPANVSTDSAFTLSWSAIVAAARYELQQSVNQSSWSTIQGDANRSATLQRRAGTFFYRVRACNAAGCSQYSAIHKVQVEGSTNVVEPQPEEAP